MSCIVKCELELGETVTFSKVAVTSGVTRRQRFSADLKLDMIAKAIQRGLSTNYAGRGSGAHGVWLWWWLMSDRCRDAARGDDGVAPAAELRAGSRTVVGHTMLEQTILKEALALRGRKTIAVELCVTMKTANDRLASTARTSPRGSKECVPNEDHRFEE